MPQLNSSHHPFEFQLSFLHKQPFERVHVEPEVYCQQLALITEPAPNKKKPKVPTRNNKNTLP